MKNVFALFTVLLLSVSVLAGCGNSGGGGDTIKVGSKDFTEQLILAQITIQALEANGISTEDRSNVAGSDTCRQALLNGEFDVYWEYTGTAWLMLLGNEPLMDDADRMFEKLRETDAENGIVWLDYAPLNNTYALVMAEARSRELGITSFSELGEFLAANPGELVLACDHEFTARPDGLPGLVEKYGMNFGDSISTMDMGIVFRTLADGQADVGMVFATDGRIKQNNLVLLKDDKSFFPIYNPAPNVRQDALDRFPQIADILKPISAKLTDEVMQDLNLQVDSGEMEPAEAAEEWLRAEGFIS
jgi:osmoprotectant transport system substrate-binding protein